MSGRAPVCAALLTALTAAALTGCSGGAERSADPPGTTSPSRVVWKPRPGLARRWQLGELSPFVAACKAVFHVEYTEPRSGFHVESRRLKLSSMLKEPELGVWRRPC
ncbi:hypothetical protein ACFY64_34110 [Streptomyces collinus]|uniref:hypothetical protein n=1 Tax=Streptomyces collinus TaxID=42684 RepID=UPI0036ACC632